MSRFRFTLVPAIAALVLLAACGDDTIAPPSNSGIEGTVTIGPMCPVVQENTPCPDEAYVATIVIEDLDGDEVARTQSGEDGRYRVGVAPGTYWLLPQWPNEGAPPSAPEQQVEVRAGEYTHADIQYDSGIR